MPSFFKKKLTANHIASFVISIWPISILAILSCLLFITNYQSGTYLLGWDVTMPELNLGLNLKRFLFGVWQEYRGLGTLDGMAHTANIVHWIIIAGLSLFLPENTVRYVFQIGIHLFGGIGIYILSQYLFSTLFPRSHRLICQFSGLLTALMYMFNLMTIQMFYAPLELFSWHFVALPWGIWSLLNFLNKTDKTSLWLFILIQFLVTPQAHVPSLFIVYALTLSGFLLGHLWTLDKHVQSRVIQAGVILFAINAFWGLPYLYSATHKSSEIASSTINQLSTTDIFFRNAAWGDLRSVFTFGSFNLDYFDWKAVNQPNQFMLEKWRSWYATPVFQTLSVAFSLLSIGGGIVLALHIKRKKRVCIPLILIWIFALTMLGTTIPIIGTFSQILRDTVPFFADIFRFTFTKFSLLYVCCVSILVGSFFIKLSEVFPSHLRSIGTSSVISIISILLLYSIQPSFQGNFFYPELKKTLPQEYQSAQQFFAKENPSGRVLVLPFHGLWGWTNNTWGHRGSGFFWQMIEQPTMDRAFDAWSSPNEEAYTQFRATLLNQDKEQFAQLLQKYQIEYIFLDKSIFQPGEYESTLLLNEIPQLLGDISEMQKVFEQGSLEIYSYNLPKPDSVKNVSETKEAKLLQDPIFLTEGNYVQYPEQKATQYPFVYFLHSPLNKPVAFDQQTQSVDLKLFKPAQQSIIIPPFQESISSLTLTISAEKVNNDLFLILTPNMPSLRSSDINQTVSSSPKRIAVSPFPTDEEKLFVVVGDQTFPLILPPTDQTWLVGTVSLPLQSTVTASVFSGKTLLIENRTDSYAQQEVAECWKFLEKEWFIYKEPDRIALKSKNAAACVSQLLTTPQTPTLLEIQTLFSARSPHHGSLCIREVDTYPCLNTQDYTRQEQGGYRIYSSVVLDKPEYSIDLRNQVDVLDEEQSVEFTDIQVTTHPLILTVNFDSGEFTTEYQQKLTHFINTLNQDNIETVVDFSIPITQLNSGTERVNRSVGKLGDLNCDQLKRGQVEKRFTETGHEYFSQNKAILCDTFNYPNLDPRQDYLYVISGENLNGVGTKVTVRNSVNYQKTLEVSTPSQQRFAQQFVILGSETPLQTPDGRKGQTLHFALPSYGSEKNYSRIDQSYFVPFPVQWLSQISLNSEDNNFSLITPSQTEEVGTFYYSYVIPHSDSSSIFTLNQTFEPGWIAFPSWKFWQPFTHIKYNDWANAWIVEKMNSQPFKVTIIFWPQLLSFVGYGILIGTIGYYAWQLKK